jgi:hypothetical protein
VVGVEHDDDLAGGELEGRVQRARLAAFGVGWPPDEPDERVLGGHLLQQLAGSVGRVVVHQEDLEQVAWVVEGDHAPNQRVGDELLVVAGNQHADGRRVVVLDVGPLVQVHGGPPGGRGEGHVAHQEDDEDHVDGDHGEGHGVVHAQDPHRQRADGDEEQERPGAARGHRLELSCYRPRYHAFTPIRPSTCFGRDAAV